MTNLCKNNGVTLIILVVTVIVLMILLGVSVFAGRNLMKTISVEEVQTNMISIRAKAKGIAEEVNAKVWSEDDANKSTKRAELYQADYGMAVQSSEPDGISQSPLGGGTHECYEITKATLDKMSLSKIYEKDEYEDSTKYYVVYDSNDFTNLDIICNPGVEYEDTVYYSLAVLQEKFEQ